MTLRVPPSLSQGSSVGPDNGWRGPLQNLLPLGAAMPFALWEARSSVLYLLL